MPAPYAPGCSRSEPPGGPISVKARLHNFSTHQPVEHPAGPHRPARHDGQRGPQRAGRPWTTVSGVCGCSGWGCGGWRTGCRRTSSATRTDDDADDDGVAAGPGPAAGLVTLAWTSSTTRWGPAGCGDRGGGVTVRFESAYTTAGPVRSYAVDDPDLQPYSPTASPEAHSPGSTPPSRPGGCGIAPRRPGCAIAPGHRPDTLYQPFDTRELVPNA